MEQSEHPIESVCSFVKDPGGTAVVCSNRLQTKGRKIKVNKSYAKKSIFYQNKSPALSYCKLATSQTNLFGATERCQEEMSGAHKLATKGQPLLVADPWGVEINYGVLGVVSFGNAAFTVVDENHTQMFSEILLKKQLVTYSTKLNTVIMDKLCSAKIIS